MWSIVAYIMAVGLFFIKDFFVFGHNNNNDVQMHVIHVHEHCKIIYYTNT